MKKRELLQLLKESRAAAAMERAVFQDEVGRNITEDIRQITNV